MELFRIDIKWFRLDYEMVQNLELTVKRFRIMEWFKIAVEWFRIDYGMI